LIWFDPTIHRGPAHLGTQPLQSPTWFQFVDRPALGSGLSVEIPGAALGGMPRQVPVQVNGSAAPFVESNILYFTVTASQ
jgi:hypothetical protein